MDSAEKKMIRSHLGHGEGNRVVRIKNNGEVHYYGSTIDTDRDHDWWHYGGMAEEILAGISAGRATS